MLLLGKIYFIALDPLSQIRSHILFRINNPCKMHIKCTGCSYDMSALLMHMVH